MHILKAHTPNEGFLKSIQKKLQHQFWLGRNDFLISTIYPGPEDGGCGLVSIEHKVESFHLRTLQTIVYAKKSFKVISTCTLGLKSKDLNFIQKKIYFVSIYNYVYIYILLFKYLLQSSFVIKSNHSKIVQINMKTSAP